MVWFYFVLFFSGWQSILFLPLLSTEENTLKQKEGVIGGFTSKEGVRLQLKAGKLKLHGLKECNVWIRGKQRWDSCCLEPLAVVLHCLHIKKKSFGHP